MATAINDRSAGLRQQLADPAALLELFVIANLAFLAADIYVAHSINEFAHAAEWIPFYFSLIAPVLLLIDMAVRGRLRPVEANRTDSRPSGWKSATTMAAGLLVGGGSIAIGIAGLLFHLESQFFQDQTLQSLVYTAPFVAPLSYAGLGLLVLLNRIPPASLADWARWVLLLAMGGFLGNFVLSLADHAQVGLLDWREWIPVISAALATAALLVAVSDFRNRPFLDLCLWIMLLQVVVAIVGWVLHLISILESPMESTWEQIVYSAPVFAPLLFADLAILAAIGLWTLRRAATSTADVAS